jgi:hypothetical protein
MTCLKRKYAIAIPSDRPNQIILEFAAIKHPAAVQVYVPTIGRVDSSRGRGPVPTGKDISKRMALWQNRPPGLMADKTSQFAAILYKCGQFISTLLVYPACFADLFRFEL